MASPSRQTSNHVERRILKNERRATYSALAAATCAAIGIIVIIFGQRIVNATLPDPPLVAESNKLAREKEAETRAIYGTMIDRVTSALPEASKNATAARLARVDLEKKTQKDLAVYDLGSELKSKGFDFAEASKTPKLVDIYEKFQRNEVTTADKLKLELAQAAVRAEVAGQSSGDRLLPYVVTAMVFAISGVMLTTFLGYQRYYCSVAARLETYLLVLAHIPAERQPSGSDSRLSEWLLSDDTTSILEKPIGPTEAFTSSIKAIGELFRGTKDS